MLIVLRGELVVCEECNRVTWTFLIKLDTRRKDMGRYVGVIPEEIENRECPLPHRKATVAEPALRRIYDALGIDASPGGVKRLTV